jgi:hypothetical protein
MDQGDLISFDDPVARLNTDQVMDLPPPYLDLGHIYRKCKTAKESAYSAQATVFTENSSVRIDALTHTRIGGLDWMEDRDVLATFHAGRMSKGQRIVNQCMSMSFDPRNLTCLGCKSKHGILDGEPVYIMMSYQNFASFIQDSEGHCYSIIREENASLSDLVELAFEVFKKPLPPGSIVALGSASYLCIQSWGQYLCAGIH